MKRAKTVLAFILSLVIVFCEFSVYKSVDAEAAEKVIEMTEADLHVIPDKYNTGCSGKLTKVNIGDTVNGITFTQSGSGEKTQMILDFANANKDFSGTVILSDLDFSTYEFVAFHEEKVESDRGIHVIFKNCKFSIFRNKEDCPDNISYEFINCSFTRFMGSQAVLNWCNLGHSYSDAIVLFRNVTVNDSYISDLASYDKAGAGVHSDGIQLYGRDGIDIYNINLNRCRFEIPAIKTGDNTASVNACLMLQPEYANGIGIHFSDCIINGGGYSIYAGCKQRSKPIAMYDVTFSNIKVGYAKLFGSVYPTIDSNVKMIQVTDQDALYVSSVWKDKAGIHVTVTNDTGEERVLKVATETGVYKYTIPACRGSKDLRYDTSGLKFSDFPFDIDIVLPKQSNYVICYEYVGKKNNQIRVVSFDGEQVVFDEKQLKSVVIASGTCGKKATWQVTDDGILKIKGSGATYNYSDTDPAPWNGYAKSIKTIQIEEGIKTLGDQAFVKLSKAKKVEIPSTVKTIGDSVFAKKGLKKCIYAGTKSEWKEIVTGTGNNALKKSKKKFSK